MEEKVLKLMSYFALLALLVWAVASSLGKRDQLTPSNRRCDQKPDGNIWARRNVPLPVSGTVAAAIPVPPQGYTG
jgi:hypothetical protein